jgi:hypothetical protein
VRVELAQEDRAGLAEPARGRRVGPWHAVGQDLGAASRADAGRVVEVLERDRHAVERAAARASPELLCRPPGVLARALGRDRDVGVEVRVQPLDAAQVRLGQLER